MRRSDFHGKGPETFSGTWVVRCVHREHTVSFTPNALATAWCTTPAALLPLFFWPLSPWCRDTYKTLSSMGLQREKPWDKLRQPCPSIGAVLRRRNPVLFNWMLRTVVLRSSSPSVARWTILRYGDVHVSELILNPVFPRKTWRCLILLGAKSAARTIAISREPSNLRLRLKK